MKKVISICALLLCTGLFARGLEICEIDPQYTVLKSGNTWSPESDILVKRICIEGYVWLKYDYNRGSMSQMFEGSSTNSLAKPVECSCNGRNN